MAKSTRRRWAALLAAGLLAGGLWVSLSPRAGDDVQAPGAPAPALPASPPRAPPVNARALQPTTPSQDDGASAHPDVEAVDPEDEDTPVEPHPISAQRQAMIPPWATFHDVKALLDAGDFARARALLKEREAVDPRAADWEDFYTGLGLMSECLEAPSASTRTRAEAFLEDFRASPLRRHVRRKCLGSAR